MIQLENISLSYGSRTILREVSLHLAAGEFCALIGRNGAGKSTLVRCINLLENPDGGEILYHGKDILTDESVNMPQYHAKVGMVFQQFNLFPQYNVIENVTLAPLLLAILPRPSEKGARIYPANPTFPCEE